MAQIRTPSNRSIVARLFISPGEPRLRAGWRLLLQTILLVVMAVVAGIIIYMPVFLLGLSSASLIFAQLVELIAITGSVFAARAFLDRRSIQSLGLWVDQRAIVDVLAGILITFIMMAAIYLAMVAWGWSRFESFAWQSESMSSVVWQTSTVLVIFIFVGWNEELLSRGYHLQTFASGFNLTWGIILSSALFAFLHIFNPNATWVSTAGIFLAGLFLAYGYICTKQLWLPIGLHIGWNFFEGSVFGFPVSGLEIYRVLRHQVTGPDLWTGGAFGPEAGLIVLPALALGVVLINIYSNHMRHAGAD